MTPVRVNGKIMDYASLKNHIVKTLDRAKRLIIEERFEEVEKMLSPSPAGDGYGCDNMFINFDEQSEYGMDISEAVSTLMLLKEIEKEKVE